MLINLLKYNPFKKMLTIDSRYRLRDREVKFHTKVEENNDADNNRHI